MHPVARRRRPLPVAVARKTSARTGQVTYYVSTPRLRWWELRKRWLVRRHLARFHFTSGATVHIERQEG